MIVTKAERNLIRELGRRPCLEVLRELFEELPTEDQERVQSGLHIGRVINEYQDAFRRGDFLVRNVMGADDSGGIAITDLVRVGQTVQFHVRDAETADEDLREPDRVRAARPPRGPDRRGPALHLQRPGDSPLRPARPRRRRPPRAVRPDPRRRLLRHGRDRPGRRPELRPRLHRERGDLRGNLRLSSTDRRSTAGKSVNGPTGTIIMGKSAQPGPGPVGFVFSGGDGDDRGDFGFVLSGRARRRVWLLGFRPKEGGRGEDEGRDRPGLAARATRAGRSRRSARTSC